MTPARPPVVYIRAFPSCPQPVWLYSPLPLLTSCLHAAENEELVGLLLHVFPLSMLHQDFLLD